jgi:hypothetical protein
VALAALDDWDDERNGFTARCLAATTHASDVVRPLLVLLVRVAVAVSPGDPY